MSAYIVAPLVGAWIEIISQCCNVVEALVAPLVGAWIEISKKATACSAVRQSLLSWERGLKYRISLFEVKTKKSLLSRERGLKY